MTCSYPDQSEIARSSEVGDFIPKGLWSADDRRKNWQNDRQLPGCFFPKPWTNAILNSKEPQLCHKNGQNMLIIWMKKRLTDRKRVSFSSDRKTGAVVLVVGKDGALVRSEFDWFWACLKRCLANGPPDLCQIHSWSSVIWANSGFWKAATSKANIAILRMNQMDKKMWTPQRSLQEAIRTTNVEDGFESAFWCFLKGLFLVKWLMQPLLAV